MTVIPSHTARTFVMLEQSLARPGMSFLQALIFRTLLIAFLLMNGVTLELTEREVASLSITEGMGREATRQGEKEEAGTLSSGAQEVHAPCQERSTAPQDATPLQWLSSPKG